MSRLVLTASILVLSNLVIPARAEVSEPSATDICYARSLVAWSDSPENLKVTPTSRKFKFWVDSEGQKLYLECLEKNGSSKSLSKNGQIVLSCLSRKIVMWTDTIGGRNMISNGTGISKEILQRFANSCSSDIEYQKSLRIYEAEVAPTIDSVTGRLIQNSSEFKPRPLPDYAGNLDLLYPISPVVKKESSPCGYEPYSNYWISGGGPSSESNTGQGCGISRSNIRYNLNQIELACEFPNAYNKDLCATLKRLEKKDKSNKNSSSNPINKNVNPKISACIAKIKEEKWWETTYKDPEGYCKCFTSNRGRLGNDWLTYVHCNPREL